MNKVMQHLKHIRLTYYYGSESTRDLVHKHAAAHPRIVISCPFQEEPVSSISLHRMRKAQSDSRLDESEKATLAAAYERADAELLRLRADLTEAERTAACTSLAKIGFIMPDLDTILITVR
jgi:hypothetical protein